MSILVTGAAGFIGSYLCQALLEQGYTVIGVDNLNSYYAESLKLQRLNRLKHHKNFSFLKLDINDIDLLVKEKEYNNIETIINLAAQAGVRYSLTAPHTYAHSNLTGFLKILEFTKNHPKNPFLIYASSSSVYGNSTPAPFSEDAVVNHPASLYAATKRSNELMSESYSHLYGLKQVGLRFFTVYGPWGRPDMAYWLFADRILNNEPINVFNHGDLERDFTWIGDIIEGIISIFQRGESVLSKKGVNHQVYNIGNNRPVKLNTFIETLETALGQSAKKQMLDMQPGDVYKTCADITKIQNDFGFEPKTTINVGLKHFTDWFKAYHKEHLCAPA